MNITEMMRTGMSSEPEFRSLVGELEGVPLSMREEHRGASHLSFGGHVTPQGNVAAYTLYTNLYTLCTNDSKGVS